MTEHYTNKLRCGICLCRYRNPKILPCFHTFCLHCLLENCEVSAHEGKFPCPVCRTVTIIPEKGVAGFQSNFYLNEDMEVNQGNQQGQCDACGSLSEIDRKCVECIQCFCKGCCEVHLRMTASRDHTLIELSEDDKERVLSKTQRLCDMHALVIQAFCEDCKMLMCKKCLETAHVGHNDVIISKIVEEKRTQLREAVESAHDNIEELEKDAALVKRQAENKFLYFNEQILHLKCVKDAVVDEINKKFLAFEDQIQKMNHEQQSKALDLINERKRVINEFKQVVDESKRTMDESDADVLINFDDLAGRLKEVEFTLSPAESGKKLMGTVEDCTTWLLKIRDLNKTDLSNI